MAEGLLKFAVDMDRRALRTYAENLHWQFSDSKQLHLSLFLTAGSYATALLREIVEE